ncbi:BZ3500_MvSof-1268-A1-R1_Chr3-1g05497 [Microbotryum saponariae]|uniref:BZ3500_MvSof-1268-A1-R1_Chr3-1g05497 protein n=1 Tax=Microbotryum saponariae TaxID=289078 RepID=A0A2X0LI28_9BASI|nr:BZ3500_MvSof-1268-A1-R1_Chr3-1g05497 [Microbotryum saponariae]SDA04688.1 BZ3501_MvSof-1269-A2-R1_Chr3-1g05168 [Microbotryum saponariae]
MTVTMAPKTKTKAKWIPRTKANVLLGLCEPKPVKEPVISDLNDQRPPRLPWGTGLSQGARKRRRAREAVQVARAKRLEARGVTDKEKVDKNRGRRSMSPSLPFNVKQDDSGDEGVAAESLLQPALDSLEEEMQENISADRGDTPDSPLYSPSSPSIPLKTFEMVDRLVPSDRDYFRAYFAELARRNVTVRSIL